jgi:type II secretory pathway pseudopilin PulG
MGTSQKRQHGGGARRATDGGFSLVEVVVAMLLLMVISLAVVPLLITATASSVDNRDLATANALANAEIAEIRARYPDSSTTTSCGSVLASAGGVDASTGLTTTYGFGACPAQYPGTVTVTVTVREEPGSPMLTSVPTKILVSTS